MSDPNQALIAQIKAWSDRRQRNVASLSMDDIAEATGVSRSGLYRRFGSRKAIESALIDAGEQESASVPARERLITAATAIIRDQGIQALTLEAAAMRAEVAIPTVYATFGNRSGLMTGVFSVHSPIPKLIDTLGTIELTSIANIRQGIRSGYGVIWDLLHEDGSIILAIVAEAIRDPSGQVLDWVVATYLPAVSQEIFPWFTHMIEAGFARPIHPAVMGQFFIAPITMHVATRGLMATQGIALPDRESTLDIFTDVFWHAIASKESIS